MAVVAASPRLWIVAGPNGSGKSTLYDATDIEGFGKSVWIINPDLLAARIRVREGLDLLDANLAAVERIENWLRSSVETYQTIGVETVLSTDKYQSLVTAAKSRGFELRLLYVMLRSVELNIERVRLRVAKGGHAVAEDKILGRHRRSLGQLPWFLEQADWARIYDNSGAEPKLVGQKTGGIVELDPSAPADLLSTLGQKV
ncbi:AAA family ATPase [Ancylobacter oerskovii]|uniref:AAA family ATPase n=1 Tax=Ancylobacter oerskovii TaxID=459519 RepID=A0ABW4YYB6_9HYPH|nr:zeta toxin family protein [Ancylobacter oerskovii]MBS7541745.1 zeta toxin family protein [Ancylobacter oerskovii]